VEKRKRTVYMAWMRTKKKGERGTLAELPIASRSLFEKKGMTPEERNFPDGCVIKEEPGMSGTSM